jgi:hypothetical protein
MLIFLMGFGCGAGALLLIAAGVTWYAECLSRAIERDRIEEGEQHA